jgi:hypothetical protein
MHDSVKFSRQMSLIYIKWPRTMVLHRGIDLYQLIQIKDLRAP